MMMALKSKLQGSGKIHQGSTILSVFGTFPVKNLTEEKKNCDSRVWRISALFDCLMAAQGA